MPQITRDNMRRNLIAGFVGGYFAVEFVSFLGLTRYWISIAPKSPVLPQGMVYAHNEHGSISYFTAFQATASALMFWCGMAAVLMCIGIAPKRDITVTRWRGVGLGAGWKNDDPHGRMTKGAAFGATFGLAAIFLLGPILVRWLNSLGVVLTF